MNHVASTLGVALPFSNARAAAMMSRPKRQRAEQGSLFLSHRDSLLCAQPIFFKEGKNKQAPCDDDCCEQDDDDTLSTVSSCDTDSFSSTCSSMANVSFAPQVVSEVRYRPRTLPEEKATLFYTDVEYRQFRRDFCSGRRGRMVKFSDQVVTNVFTYPDPAESVDKKDALFYSESDLQRFLDEFVSSLNGNSV